MNSGCSIIHLCLMIWWSQNIYALLPSVKSEGLCRVEQFLLEYMALLSTPRSPVYRGQMAQGLSCPDPAHFTSRLRYLLLVYLLTIHVWFISNPKLASSPLTCWLMSPDYCATTWLTKHPCCMGTPSLFPLSHPHPHQPPALIFL